MKELLCDHCRTQLRKTGKHFHLLLHQVLECMQLAEGSDGSAVKRWYLQARLSRQKRGV